MARHESRELEEVVQRVERDHGEWSAVEIERELARLAPVAYSRWKEGTPNLRSRLRSVQRWRAGLRGRGASATARQLFPYVWPVGERQRREIEPAFGGTSPLRSGCWRIFLYNCSAEVVRDVRVFLDNLEIDYAPSILEGKFAEIHWQKHEDVRGRLLDQAPPPLSRHRLRVEFVIARGTRQSAVDGELVLDVSQGWTHFGSRDGRSRDLE
ncbi:MAG TPA: hypothetical protein VFF67_06080 [Thermoplasmata archaeon]|nr:hypothetical protein [Thermoplasmata archaeon]